MKKVLGNYRQAGTIGSRRAFTGAALPPPATSSGRPLVQQRPKAEPHLNANDVLLKGPLPDEEDDGYVAQYDVSEYTIFYYPNKAMDASSEYQSVQRKKMSRSPRKGGYRVFFVNGMQGNPEKFRAQACATAAVSGGPVTGVYNRGVNFAADLLQCATDKVFSNDWLNLKVEAWKLFGSPSQKEIDDFVYENLRESNYASAALYLELMRNSGESRIVAHSQGNIIMCNAVNGVYAARGSAGIQKIRLFAVASPVVFWSNAKPCLENGAELNFSNDLVSWLGFNGGDEAYLRGWSANENTQKFGESEITESYEPSKLNLATHQFYIYLERYWRALQSRFE